MTDLCTKELAMTEKKQTVAQRLRVLEETAIFYNVSSDMDRLSVLEEKINILEKQMALFDVRLDDLGSGLLGIIVANTGAVSMIKSVNIKMQALFDELSKMTNLDRMLQSDAIDNLIREWNVKVKEGE